ncbi:hypothetical protein M8C21_014060 [Ambrosia artemisiifolia]|uniref:PGG domain-containing protein n=1 Tax=Ambrosia artemisiifolia TaxID=4212 RepID=A0AAD5C2B7_AMBAR|nr:hypothetical protein M8C21_014060 [Ambrosia artemisiifolia]
MATHTTLLVQQPQGSTYNHPCEDLLDGGRQREYLDIAVPLYRASIEGNLEAAKVILQGHEYLVRYSINERKETPLHVAAASHNIDFVRYLVNMMSSVELELQNADGNTAFCIAAISGNVDMAKVMFEKNQALPIICGSENMKPLYLAAFHRNFEMVNFLYNQSRRMIGNGWTNDDMDRVMLICVQAGNFGGALRILRDNVELPQDRHTRDVLHALAEKPWAFYENNIWQAIFPVPFVKRSNATPLLRLLWKRIMEKRKEVIDEILRGPMVKTGEMEAYPSHLLFIAAKMSNTQFVVELIREYPDLIWKRNDDGQTIFHIAVAHRDRDTFFLLYEIGSMKDLITPITDKEGNNILHLVGKIPEKNSFSDWTAAPFQMETEFLWFKEVKGILPPPCREVKNTAGQTPQQLFTESHRGLGLESMKWINQTINISLVIAVLVCTMGFSIVFAFPGGFDQQKGFPIFHHNKCFIAFVVMDAMSFILSSTSILIFLGVILSRHHPSIDFLLQIWMFGQLLLLTSVFFLALAFILSFFVLYLKSWWTYVILYFVYVMGQIVILCCGTAVDAFNSVSDFHFMPKKQRLYGKSKTP